MTRTGIRSAPYLVVAVILLLGAAGCGPRPPAPEERTATLRIWITTYVELLNSADVDGLTAHLGANLDRAADAKARIIRYGGQGLHDVQVRHEVDAAVFYSVTITAVRTGGAAVRMQETMVWHDRWVLVPLPDPSLPTPSGIAVSPT